MFGKMPKKIVKLSLLKWLSIQLLNRPLAHGGLAIRLNHYIGKLTQLQAGFEELNLGRFFRNMLERHPQIDPSYHEIQLDLPGDSQTCSRADLPPSCNITVEYAEKQMSHSERHLLQMLSTFTNRPACVDEIAVATSLDASALLTIQVIYHDPKRAEWTTYEYIVYHILITWYASS